METNTAPAGVKHLSPLLSWKAGIETPPFVSSNTAVCNLLNDLVHRVRSRRWQPSWSPQSGCAQIYRSEWCQRPNAPACASCARARQRAKGQRGRRTFATPLFTPSFCYGHSINSNCAVAELLPTPTFSASQGRCQRQLSRAQCARLPTAAAALPIGPVGRPQAWP